MAVEHDEVEENLYENTTFHWNASTTYENANFDKTDSIPEKLPIQ